MVKVTLDDLTLMIEEMKKNNITQLYLDATDVWDCSVDIESVNFDMHAPNDQYVKTILTIDE